MLSLWSVVFIYYNVSYLNNYLTQHEQTARKVRFETVLKRFAGLPLPKVTRIRSQVNLYPDKQQALTHAWVTIQNKTKQPITQLVVDGEELTDFRIKTGGKAIPYTYPLYYPRGLFNFFRPETEPAEYRLYHFDRALLPGDSLVLEVHSWQVYPGFRNDTYAETMLHNGTLFQGGLPSLGYDASEELTDPFERRTYHLPTRTAPGAIPQDDPAGRATLESRPDH